MVKGKTIRVEAIWDGEAQVWVATSDDVPGLITEADTSEQLIEKLQVMIPELLQANGLISENDPSDIPLHLLSKRTEMIKSRVN
jgi:predicted RNase H-like HicB family nuclease